MVYSAHTQKNFYDEEGKELLFWGIYYITGKKTETDLIPYQTQKPV
jgi:hypothetical protein